PPALHSFPPRRSSDLQRVPDLRRAGALRLLGARRGVIVAVRLCPLGHIVGPTDIRLVEEIRQVCPCVVRFSDAPLASRGEPVGADRKSTRLNSSHGSI